MYDTRAPGSGVCVNHIENAARRRKPVLSIRLRHSPAMVRASSSVIAPFCVDGAAGRRRTRYAPGIQERRCGSLSHQLKTFMDDGDSLHRDANARLDNGLANARVVRVQ